MLTIFAFIFLLIFSIVIFIPLLWVLCGKIFKIDNLTFKKALVTCLIVSLIGVIFELIIPFLNLLEINNIFIYFFTTLTCLIITIWIIKKKFNTTVFRSIGVYLSSIICAVGLALFIRTYVVQAFKIPSGAMKQTILVGDHIIADKFVYKYSEPKRGDIIIFPFPEDPSKDFIKRVVGLGGETIEIRDKQIIINGQFYQEHYKVINDPNIFPENIQPRDNCGPIKIPEDSLFVMGDNRDHSYDSRYWGFVKMTSVKGKAINIYWSWDKEKSKVRLDRIGKNIK